MTNLYWFAGILMKDVGSDKHPQPFDRPAKHSFSLSPVRISWTRVRVNPRSLFITQTTSIHFIHNHIRGLSIKNVDFLCNSGSLYDNLMKSCIDKVLFMLYFMMCNIRQCFNMKYSLFMFPWQTVALCGAHDVGLVCMLIKTQNKIT